MKQEDKDLLVKDLCSRVYYQIKVLYNGNVKEIQYVEPLYYEVKLLDTGNYTIDISDIKPYLRPMSSMTEEERKIYAKFLFADLGGVHEDYYKALDYLNSIHIDYRGFIEKRLAISTEEYNPYKS